MFDSGSVVRLFFLIPFILTLSSNSFANSCAKEFAKWKVRALEVQGTRASKLSFARSIIRSNSKMTDEEFVDGLNRNYSDLAKLTGEVDATPGALGMRRVGKSPSEAVFGKSHSEYDRTVMGLLILKWTLEGNYKKVVAGQSGRGKLSRESFREMQAWTKEVLKDAEAVEAMISFLVINDLGKVRSIVSEIQQRLGTRETDHDKLLYAGLDAMPELSDSFQGVSPHYRALMLEGLRPGFNMGQFMRGENTPHGLTGIRQISAAARDFYMLHFVYDLAGVLGHKNPNGAVVLIDGLWKRFVTARESLGIQTMDRAERQIYSHYLKQMAGAFGLRYETKEDVAIVRFILHIDNAPTKKKAREIRKAYLELPANTRAILERELEPRDIGEEIPAIRLYYGPDVASNTIRRLAENPLEGYKEALTNLARIYQAIRIAIKKKRDGGEQTVMVDALARKAAEENLSQYEITASETLPGLVHVSLNRWAEIPVERYRKQDRSFPEFGDRVGFVAIGGGSDNRQSIIMGKLFQAIRTGGKQTPFFISVRSAKTESQDASGRIGQERTVENPKNILAEDVYEIGTQSRGSGRWMEHLSAGEVRVFYVIDRADGALTRKIRRVIEEVGGVSDLVGLDTGGDCLFDVRTKVETSKATPDQDLRVIDAMTHLDRVAKLHTMVVAPGIDVPRHVKRTLSLADARHYTLDAIETELALSTYREWQLDGTHGERYGKTSFTWQMALRGKRGLQVVPLPTRLVSSLENPWSPFVHIQDATAGVFLMELKRHRWAIDPSGIWKSLVESRSQKTVEHVLAQITGKSGYTFLSGRDVEGINGQGDGIFSVPLERLMSAMGEPGAAPQDRIRWRYDRSQIKRAAEELIHRGHDDLIVTGAKRPLTASDEVRVGESRIVEVGPKGETEIRIPAEVLLETLKELYPTNPYLR